MGVLLREQPLPSMAAASFLVVGASRIFENAPRLPEERRHLVAEPHSALGRATSTKDKAAFARAEARLRKKKRRRSISAQHAGMTKHVSFEKKRRCPLASEAVVVVAVPWRDRPARSRPRRAV
jgi:hypothetical protein